MADFKLQARISEELESKIKKIGETIQNENPGAEATISTICRYALEDYIKRYNGRKNKDTLYIEIPINILNIDEMLDLEGSINLIEETIKNATTEKRRIERKSKVINSCKDFLDPLKNDEIAKKLEDYEIKITNEFFENTEKSKKLCEEKILGFIREKQAKSNKNDAITK